MRCRAVVVAAAALAACSSGTAPQRVAVPEGQWIQLFNGRDLNGWTAKFAGEPVGANYLNTFRVEGGLLKVDYDRYATFADHFGSLFFDRKLSHYWLRARYRFVGSLAPGAPGWAYKNSGLQLHCQSPASMARAQQFPVSVEFDIVGGHFIGSRPTGDVCHYGTTVLVGGKPLTALCSKVSNITIRDDRWVTVLAEVDGARAVRQIVDGVEVVRYTDIALDERNPDARRLLDGGAARVLDSGYVSIQSNGFPIEFQSIDVLPIN